DPQLQVPAEFGHRWIERLDVREAHTVLVVWPAVAAEFVGAQTAHAGFVPGVQRFARQFRAADRDAAQALRLPHQRVERGAVVAAVGAGLHDDAALASEPVEQREIGFKWCVFGRVAARLLIGKPRRRPEDVTMAVAGVRRQCEAHCGLRPASFAAAFMFAASVAMKAAKPFCVICSAVATSAPILARRSAAVPPGFSPSWIAFSILARTSAGVFAGARMPM